MISYQKSSCKKIHVLIYINRLGVGGVQRFVYEIAEEMERVGIKVSIFCHIPELCLYDRNEPIFRKIRVFTFSKQHYVIVGINIIRNWTHRLGFNFDFKEWCNKKYFLYVVKKHQVNIIHSNIGDLNFIHTAKQKHNTPFIATLHGLDKQSSVEKSITQDAMIRTLVAEAGSIVYLSKDDLKLFEEVLKKNIINSKIFKRIYNGLKIPQETRSKKQETRKFIFGMIARGIPQKGWEETIEAFTIVKQIQKNIELHLYMSSVNHNPSYYKTIEKKCKFIEGIYFFGETHHPLEVAQSFDVGLLTSYSEAMPYTIMEYLICSKPVIATSVGAIPEMIEDPEGNLAGTLIHMVQGKPSIEAIKDAMLNYLTDSTLYQTHKFYALSASKKFDIKHCANEYIKTYQDVLDRSFK